MDLLQTIGQTPLIQLKRLSNLHQSSIWAKCEFLNPTGSIKDRIAAYIISEAEKKGLIKADTTLIESTSGNTGAAIAMIAAQRGYHAILVLPDRVSEEKKRFLKALGAEVHVMPSHVSIDSDAHYINVAKQLQKTLPNSFYVNQYYNLDNPKAHYQTTGPEIWEQTQGKIDTFVCVAGSGGTISGVGRYLKEKNSAIKVIAMDPIGSVYYSYFKHGKLPDKTEINPCMVEGAGEDHLVNAMDFSIIDDIIQFEDRDAFLTARHLAHQEGLLTGGSSGANVWGALQFAKREDRPMRIVTILADHGSKYFSKLYNDTWMQSKGFLSVSDI